MRDQGLQVWRLCAEDGREVEDIVTVDDAVGRDALLQKADEFLGKSPLRRGGKGKGKSQAEAL